MQSPRQRYSRWYARHHKRIEAYRAPVFVAVGVLAALPLANLSPAAYHWIREIPVWLPVTGWVALHFVVIELLMNVFFLCAGKEIKDSITLEGGALRQGGVPFIIWITLGGVVVPMTVFYALSSWLDPEFALLSYAVMAAATDVVFAVLVGKFAFKNKQRPNEDHPAVKTLLALAVLDDLIGVALIAGFLSDIPSLWALPVIIGSFVLSVALPFGIRKLWPDCAWYWYLLCGIPPLIIFLMFHVPSAIALIGVVAGMPGPKKQQPPVRDLGAYNPDEIERDDPLDNMERWFGWPQAVILFLFAFMASGVTFSSESFGYGTLIVVVAVTGGKTLGICLMALIAVYLFRCIMPEGVGKRHFLGIGTIAGIGFTVALLVAELAHLPPPYHTGAILTLVSGVLATLVAREFLRQYERRTRSM